MKPDPHRYQRSTLYAGLLLTLVGGATAVGARTVTQEAETTNGDNAFARYVDRETTRLEFDPAQRARFAELYAEIWALERASRIDAEQWERDNQPRDDASPDTWLTYFRERAERQFNGDWIDQYDEMLTELDPLLRPEQRAKMQHFVEVNRLNHQLQRPKLLAGLAAPDVADMNDTQRAAFVAFWRAMESLDARTREGTLAQQELAAQLKEAQAANDEAETSRIRNELGAYAAKERSQMQAELQRLRTEVYPKLTAEQKQALAAHQEALQAELAPIRARLGEMGAEWRAGRSLNSWAIDLAEESEAAEAIESLTKQVDGRLLEVRHVLRAVRRVRSVTDAQREAIGAVTQSARGQNRGLDRADTAARGELAQQTYLKIREILDSNQRTEYDRAIELLTKRGGRSLQPQQDVERRGD